MKFANFLSIYLFFCSSFALCDEKIIGILPSLTGVRADGGEDCMRGVSVARDLPAILAQEKSKKIKFIVEDSRSEPRIAVDAFRNLINVSNVSAAITFGSPVGMAINPISKENKVPLLGGVGHKDFSINNPHAYQFWPSTDVEGVFLAESVIKEGAKKIAVLYTEDEWTTTFSESFKRKIEELGGLIVFYESILPKETDVLVLLTKIKHKNPDAVLFNHTLGEVSNVFTKAQSIGIKAKKYSNFWIGFKSALESMPTEASEDIRFPELSTDYKSYQEALKNKFPNFSKPSALNFTCYLSVIAVAQSLGNCEGTSWECMQNLSAIITPDAEIKVLDRKVQFPMQMKVIRNRKTELMF